MKLPHATRRIATSCGREFQVFGMVVFSLLASPLRATPTTDLATGLVYLRVHSINAEAAAIRQASSSPDGLVLDLRYATANEASAPTLRSAFAERPAGTRLFVLVSPETPGALAAAISASPALTLGAPGSVPLAKVTVNISAAADRRAYDALAAGTEISKLIAGRIEKERFDEATLVQEFKNGNHDPEPPLPADPTAPKDSDKPAPTAPPVIPTDRVLQRAVHLHQALLALRQ